MRKIEYVKITLRISKKTHKFFEKIAKKGGVSLSEAMRNALDEIVKG